jgi:hypothetical protein
MEGRAGMSVMAGKSSDGYEMLKVSDGINVKARLAGAAIDLIEIK